jgi:hypothetical protein
MADIAVRLSGILLIAGAVLLGTAIVVVSFAPVVNQPLPPRVSLLLLLSAILLLLSLPAMYAKQAQAAGWLGLTGRATPNRNTLAGRPGCTSAPLSVTQPGPRRKSGGFPARYCADLRFTPDRNRNHSGRCHSTMGRYPAACGDRWLLLRILRRRVPATRSGSDRRCPLRHPSCACAGLDRHCYLDAQTRPG